jgi:hypothetical protein
MMVMKLGPVEPMSDLLHFRVHEIDFLLHCGATKLHICPSSLLYSFFFLCVDRNKFKIWKEMVT